MTDIPETMKPLDDFVTARRQQLHKLRLVEIGAAVLEARARVGLIFVLVGLGAFLLGTGIGVAFGLENVGLALILVTASLATLGIAMALIGALAGELGWIAQDVDREILR